MLLFDRRLKDGRVGFCGAYNDAGVACMCASTCLQLLHQKFHLQEGIGVLQVRGHVPYRQIQQRQSMDVADYRY